MVGMMVCHIFLSTCLVIKLVISNFHELKVFEPKVIKLGLVLEKVIVSIIKL